MTVARRSPDEILERTRLFWNASPCGAQSSFDRRVQHRYALEPWVQDVLRAIAAGHTRVLEIGCGQGTDGIVLCSLLAAEGSYLGVDYSDDSVNAAKRALDEAKASLSLNVTPVFRTANAERLDLSDGSVQCVYSNGVLHHTATPSRAYDEVWRVLAPGGEAFITLYRKPSLKVGVAKALRGAQSVLDAALGHDGSLYQLIRRRPGSRLLGTMLLEGVGVPVMEWYSKRDIRHIFNKFDIIEAVPVGCNIPRPNPKSRGWTRWGYMWFVHLRKPRRIST
jgi:SAM-dependent methyltransferase